MKPEDHLEFATNEATPEVGMEEGAQGGGSYASYKNLGGIINEADYASALARQKEGGPASAMSVAQAVLMAQHAGIEIDSNASNDPRVVLYGILRNDTMPQGAEYHHAQMSDQKIFAEALRMLGDKDSLEKFTAALPHIFESAKE